MRIGLLASLPVAACVFTPPPPLPEELAAQEAEAAARSAQVDAEQVERGEAAAGAGAQSREFAEGDEPDLGMDFEEMKAFATAQGDPEGGDFTLQEALVGLPADGQLWVSLATNAGNIECRLHVDKAPRTVANFVGLARGLRPAKDARSGEWSKRNYYDDTDFHRVIEGFMIQGGDPTGSGRGNPGYVIPDEFDPSLRHDRAGVLSMANRGAGTGGAQFFVTLNPTPHLDDKHTIFGLCTDASIEIAEQIASTGDEQDRPKTRQTIRNVVIERRGARVKPEAEPLRKPAEKPAASEKPDASPP